jgi:hypothetical protein
VLPSGLGSTTFQFQDILFPTLAITVLLSVYEQRPLDEADISLIMLEIRGVLSHDDAVAVHRACTQEQSPQYQGKLNLTV